MSPLFRVEKLPLSHHNGFELNQARLKDLEKVLPIDTPAPFSFKINHLRYQKVELTSLSYVQFTITQFVTFILMKKVGSQYFQVHVVVSMSIK